jgi:hypothetical protein
MRLLWLAIAAAVMWIGWRFHADVTQVRACAMQGGTVVSTRCGPIEYEAADQGVLFARDFAAQGMRAIAPSRFGYAGTPLLNPSVACQ